MSRELEDIIESMQAEVVNSRTLALHFDASRAEDPESVELSLDAFDGAEVKVEKKAAAGAVTLFIQGAGGPPRIQW